MPLVGCDNACVIFFLARCAKGLPLCCGKVSAHEFTFQFVAVTLGFAVLIFIFLRAWLCHWSVATTHCVIFFLARCARSVCNTTLLWDGERARIYIPLCCCDIGICSFNFHFFA